MSDSEREIRCMLIPLRERRLLLPNAAVAEVIGYRDPSPLSERLDWLAGRVGWHQREIPVVDFERLLGRPVPGGSVRQRIAVCYGLADRPDWPLIGLISQGIPRLLRLSAGSIETIKGVSAGESPLRMTLMVAGEDLLVPDMEFLHRELPQL